MVVSIKIKLNLFGWIQAGFYMIRYYIYIYIYIYIKPRLLSYQ